jgi:hypothetical protein
LDIVTSADTLQKAYSVAKIEHPEVMDENGKQKVGGLMDPRMGSEYTQSVNCYTVLTLASYRPKLQMSDLSGRNGRMSRSLRSY